MSKIIKNDPHLFLLKLIKKNDIASVLSWINDHANDLNFSIKKTTPLSLACLRKNYDMVNVLLQNGADPNLIYDNTAVLIRETLYDNIDMVKALVEAGADVNLKIPIIYKEDTFLSTYYGKFVSMQYSFSPAFQTPFLTSVIMKSMKCIQYYLNHGADLTITYGHDKTIIRFVEDDAEIKKLIESKLNGFNDN